jgi:hypothetical protein
MTPAELQVVPKPEPITAMSLLQSAVDKGASIDTVERLAKLQREMMDYEATVEFNHAMMRCQERMKRIATDMTNPQTHSRYASYAQIDRAIRPIYTSEGISLSFGDGEPPSPDMVRIICYVAKGGFTRIYHKDMPIVTAGPQGKAVMTPTHATGTADSYAKRYLVKDIFNLAVGEDDNDGNASAMDESKLMEWLDAMEGCATLVELQRAFTDAYKLANQANDKNALGLLIRAKDKRKLELKQGGAF